MKRTMKKLLTTVAALAIMVTAFTGATVFGNTLNKGYIVDEIEQGIKLTIVDEELFMQNIRSDSTVMRRSSNDFLGTPQNIRSSAGKTGQWWGGFYYGGSQDWVYSQVIADTGAQGRASVTTSFLGIGSGNTTTSEWMPAGQMAEACATINVLASSTSNWDLK